MYNGAGTKKGTYGEMSSPVGVVVVVAAVVDEALLRTLTEMLTGCK
jgi:hypothetical protein